MQRESDELSDHYSTGPKLLLFCVLSISVNQPSLKSTFLLAGKAQALIVWYSKKPKQLNGFQPNVSCKKAKTALQSESRPGDVFKSRSLKNNS